MVAQALPFEQIHKHYRANWWDKDRKKHQPTPFEALLSGLNTLRQQHEKILSGELLRGVKQPVARPLPLPSHELSKRQVKILRRLKAGDEINCFGAHWQLIQGTRRCNVRSEDVLDLQRRGLVTSAFAMTQYGLNALSRVV